MSAYRMSYEDLGQALHIAGLQMARKASEGRNSDHGGRSKRSMKERWADGIHGAMAELALSRILHVEWTPGTMRVSRGDVAGKIEVRATEYSSGHLLVYPGDEDGSMFVLMVGHYPEFRVGGCLKAAEAKQQQWWRADKDPPCFWVPQASLKPLTELYREVTF